MIIRVPATSANLGPGFDTLGCALAMYAEFSLDAPAGGRAPIDDHHVAMKAFRSGGGDGPLWVTRSLPAGRGLGSSAAMRVGGLVAAAVQRHGPEIDVRDPALGVLKAASRLEGHADNAAAALHGGVVVTVDGEVVALPTSSELMVVVWIPPHATRTSASRRRLPAEVPFGDAVFTVSRAALLVAALATNRFDLLRSATQDRLHQDRRLASQPGTKHALERALEAGALGAWLSGSGPTMACWCLPPQVDDILAMLPTEGRGMALALDRSGTVVLRRG